MGGWASVCCWKGFWCVSLYLFLNIRLVQQEKMCNHADTDRSTRFQRDEGFRDICTGQHSQAKCWYLNAVYSCENNKEINIICSWVGWAKLAECHFSEHQVAYLVSVLATIPNCDFFLIIPNWILTARVANPYCHPCMLLYTKPVSQFKAYRQWSNLSLVTGEPILFFSFWCCMVHVCGCG